MSSIYKVTVKAPDERIHEVSMRADEARTAGRVRQEHKFRGGKDQLPLITVPIDYPIYRLENYRTRDQQLSLIATGKVNAGFFKPTRREDPSVQQQQHTLLLDQAKRGSGESIKPIFDELARVAEQTDHLIISADGVVVNGNRRLCAMRELFALNKTQYGSFANVLCLVLPSSATSREILELEVGLQMQPETKLPYEWTAVGRAVRDLRIEKMDDEAIAVLMNRDKNDIQRSARMIDAADLYLSEWLDRPNAYGLLEGTEQAFKQVATRNWGKADEAALREQTRKFDFFVIEHRDQLQTDSAYSLINAIESNPRNFLKTIAAEWDIDLAVKASDQQFDISFDEPGETEFDYAPLLDVLVAARADSQVAKNRLDSLVNVCAIVSDQGKERERAALKFVKQAEKSLNAADLRGADPTTFAEIEKLLERCQAHCERLFAEAMQRKKPKA